MKYIKIINNLIVTGRGGSPCLIHANIMKFSKKIGVYNVTGQALENYKIMQLRPKYKRYLARLKYMCVRSGGCKSYPVSFAKFCSIMLGRNKIKKQASLF